MKMWSVLLLLGWVLTCSAHAEVLVLREGTERYKGCHDTYICSVNPDQNFNQGNEKYSLVLRKVAGNTYRFALVRWDLPTDSLKKREIISAKIVLFVQENPYDKHDQQRVSVFPLKRVWEPSEVTWRQASSALKWAMEGAQGMEDMTLPAVAEVETRTEDRHRVEFPLPPDLVKKWVADPASNGGVLIKFTDERSDLSLHFYPCETPTKDQEMRPSLELVLK